MPGQNLAFGPFVLDPDTGTLLRQGVPVPVGYRAALLLAEMLRRPGDVLTKSELLDAGWRGMAVEEGNLSVQIAALRRLLGPAPDGGDWIATIPRVGYRFLAPVTRRDAAAPEGGPARGPSIAVLPFANLSGDPEQEHFADGLAEDIITRLARVRALFVSARDSSFAWKGRAADLKAIGRELGVRYVLGGSVRRAGQRLRTTALLSDADSGLQVWAEQYDGDVADFFALQDRITESVIAAIEPQIYAAEHTRARSRPPESLDAWGFVMQAMPYVWTWGSAADIETAQRLLARALAIDPDYPRANSLLAWTYAAQAQLGWADAAATLPLALARAQTGIAGDLDDPWGHLAAGYVHMVARRHRPALDELHEAIDRNPSLALAHVILASAYSHGGLAEDGLHHVGHRRAPRPARLHPGREPLHRRPLPLHGPPLRRDHRLRAPRRPAPPELRQRLAHPRRGRGPRRRAGGRGRRPWSRPAAPTPACRSTGWRNTTPSSTTTTAPSSSRASAPPVSTRTCGKSPVTSPSRVLSRWRRPASPAREAPPPWRGPGSARRRRRASSRRSRSSTRCGSRGRAR